MDFTNQPKSPNTNRFAQPAGHNPHLGEDKKDNDKPRVTPKERNMWVKTWGVIYLLCLVALVVALLLSLGLAKDNDNSDSFVSSGDRLTVEVGSDQAQPTYYYGSVANMNDNYLVLNNVLKVTSEPSAQAVTVEPLKCSAPTGTNQLVVNRDRIISWSTVDSDSSINSVASSSAANASCTPAQQTQQETTQSTDDTSKTSDNTKTKTDSNASNDQASNETENTAKP